MLLLNGVRGLCIVLLLFAITACSNPESPNVRMALASAPIGFDPRFATDATSSRLNRLLYQQLVEFDDNRQPVAGIASWQLISPTHYRFELNEKVMRFHNGQTLSAVDVKATYESILDPKTASPHRASLANIDTIEIISEQSLDFILNKPDPLFPGRLVIGVLPESEIVSGHPFNRQPLGSGPFSFVQWPESGRLLLERNEDKQVFEFLAVKDPTVRVLKLMRGEVDLLQNDLQPELLRYLEDQGGVTIETGNGSNFTYLGFNLQDDYVGQHDVRLAIAYAINRESIIKHLWGGAARSANALLPPDHWAGNGLIPGYKHDPDKARQILESLGYGSNKPLQLTYKTSSDAFRIRLATVIQQQLAEVGIQVELKTYDWGTFYGDIKAGRFQMYSLSWVGIKTPDIFHYVFHSDSIPPSGANRGRYFDQQADQLIEKADSGETLAVQAKHYQDLQYLLWETLPYVPLWYEDNVYVARNSIEGYRLASDGNYDGLIHVRKRGG